MTRFRALLVAGVVAMTFGFGGCFEWGGGEPCAAPAGGPSVTICEI